jgi:hypothetical protein
MAWTLIHIRSTLNHQQGIPVKQTWPIASSRPSPNQRAALRRAVALPARLTWKDQRGTTRFASVVARNVSEFGAFVECPSAVPIPLYRLVRFQLEREVRESDGLPQSLRQGLVLSAVYRIQGHSPDGTRQGLALRLMVDPRRLSATTAADSSEGARATA